MKYVQLKEAVTFTAIIGDSWNDTFYSFDGWAKDEADAMEKIENYVDELNRDIPYTVYYIEDYDVFE